MSGYGGVEEAVKRERVRVPPAGRQIMTAAVKQPRQNVARTPTDDTSSCSFGVVVRQERKQSRKAMN